MTPSEVRDKLKSIASYREQCFGPEETAMSPTLNRLGELLLEPVEDAYGRLRPTHNALSTARDLIGQTEAAYGILPVGSVSTDSEGGIRITWLGAREQVQVICPADSTEAHLYFEHGDDYGMEHKVSSATLVNHLRLGGWARQEGE